MKHLKAPQIPAVTYRVPHENVCSAIIPTNFTNFENYVDTQGCDWDYHICCFDVGPSSFNLARETCNRKLYCLTDDENLGAFLLIMAILTVGLCLVSCGSNKR
jgi:hypothetical protein